LANNLYFTHNTQGSFREAVYYAGMVGVVATWIEGDEGRGMQQRFFFGHDNDILCLTMHPNRRFVATGQQTSSYGRPYVCVWDIGEYNAEDTRRLRSKDVNEVRRVGHPRDPVQLQKLVLRKEFRSVLAVAFSGNEYAPFEGQRDKRGGELLITISGDQQHTVHIWRWMMPAEKAASAHDKLLMSHCSAIYIPSWHYGPEKKLGDLQKSYKFFCSEEEGGPKKLVPGACPRTVEAGAFTNLERGLSSKSFQIILGLFASESGRLCASLKLRLRARKSIDLRL
jgi:hypothetical protein